MQATKNIGTIGAIDLANYILKNYGPLSHLKLQKLLFYSDAYHLAYFSKQLINEEFEAWVHGPVCREVFDTLKVKSLLYTDMVWSEDEEDPNPKISEKLNSLQISFIDEVLRELTKWTDLELESATHKEDPWIAARKGLEPSMKSTNIIDKNLVAAYYSKEISLN